MPPKKKSNIRFRRLDRRNFVYETCRQKKVEGKVAEEIWEVRGFFSSLKSAALSALNDGFNGVTTLTMLDSIKTSTEQVLLALEGLKLDPSLLEVRETPEKIVLAVDDEPLEPVPAPKKERAPRKPRTEASPSKRSAARKSKTVRRKK